MTKTKSWIFLFLAIASEVIATISLKISLGAFWGYLVMGVFIIVSYYFMGLCIRVMSVGTAYAMWEALGLSLIAIIGAAFFGENLKFHEQIAIALAIIGIILINIGEKK